jgi:succinoglycan biosynthesis protein ExoV
MIYRTSRGNFGDDLNDWLWPLLAPELCEPGNPNIFLGIGTIISTSIPADKTKVVFGSGIGTQRPPDVRRRWHFYAVRGPLTAARLGLPEELAITDPAILVRSLRRDSIPKKYPSAFMPHYQSFGQANWSLLCQEAGIHLIDPREPVETVLDQIQSSELLLAEAMHGAIVADAFRVPWIPIRLYGHFLDFKWNDWTQSIQTPLNIRDVPPIFERKLMSPSGATQTFKKGMAAIRLGKSKWRKLPLWATSSAQKKRSLELLKSFSLNERPHLSAARRSGELEEMLMIALTSLRSDWQRGIFEPCPVKSVA